MEFGQTSKTYSLNKATYINLRWIGIIGQFITINSVKFIFGFEFDYIIANIIIFIGAEFLVSLFTDNSEAVKHGAIYLKVAALIGPIYPVFFITTAVFQAVKKPLYSLYLSILRLTAFPFLSLWYVINIRGGDYKDIFYTIMATNWAMGIVVLIFIGYFLNNVFKQNKPLFSY